jgi:phenylacetyl-CoA:acceptor oxidoreductase subunit 1
MTQWAMVVDLRRCIGCKACILACSQANDIEEGLWRRYQELTELEAPHRQRYFITTSCMQCSQPACLPVCPTKATHLRSDGIVDIDQNKCVGCGACIMACPYDARAILGNKHRFETGGKTRPSSIAQNAKREGTCTKCNFCLPRVQNGREANLQPGIDPDATPLCVATCSTGTLWFGDIDDPGSHVSRLIKENPTVRISAQLGTEPSIYYIIAQ